MLPPSSTTTYTRQYSPTQQSPARIKKLAQEAQPIQPTQTSQPTADEERLLDAIIHEQNGKLEDAIAIYLKLAVKGNRHAIRSLILILEKHPVIPPTLLKKIADSFKALAEQKRPNLDVLYQLALIYEQGRGVDKDIDQAQKYFQRAANADHPQALLRLGCKCRVSASFNYDRVVRLFERAAGQGNACAMVELGDMYLDGIGVVKSEINAVEYFTKAAKLGNTTAMIKLARIYWNNDEVREAITWCQAALNLGDSEAALWLVEVDEQGELGRLSRRELGQIYLMAAEKRQKDTIDGSDVEEYLAALEKAASFGNIAAALRLGTMYEKGESVPQDTSKALKVYQVALNNYQSTECGLPDTKLMAELCQRAADLNSASAMFLLATMYEHGNGVEKNRVKAIELYRQAAVLKHSGAVLSLAVMESNTEKDKCDIVEAAKLYRQAFDLGERNLIPAMESMCLEVIQQKGDNVDATTIVNLAYMYQHSWGIGKDRTIPFELLKVAMTKNSDADVFEKLKDLYIAPKQYDVAWKIFEEGIKGGFAYAFLGAGDMLQHGRGTVKNEDAALATYRIAAEKGCVDAHNKIGHLYLAQKQYDLALKEFYVGADKGSAVACQSVGYMLQHGYGNEKNEQAALEMFRTAVDKGCVDALNSIGDVYSQKGEYGTAMKVFIDASGQGSIDATHNLIKIFSGVGVNGLSMNNQVSLKQAYKRAAELGDGDAYEKFKKMVANEKANQNEERGSTHVCKPLNGRNDGGAEASEE